MAAKANIKVRTFGNHYYHEITLFLSERTLRYLVSDGMEVTRRNTLSFPPNQKIKFIKGTYTFILFTQKNKIKKQTFFFFKIKFLIEYIFQISILKQNKPYTRGIRIEGAIEI